MYFLGNMVTNVSAMSFIHHTHRTTSDPENMQNHILIHPSKHMAYTPLIYQTRMLLAAVNYSITNIIDLRQLSVLKTWLNSTSVLTVVSLAKDSKGKLLQALTKTVVATRQPVSLKFFFFFNFTSSLPLESLGRLTS